MNKPRPTRRAKGAGPARSRPADPTPILALLRARTKFDFRSYRKGMLLRRVQRRMGLSHIERLADYAKLLRDRPEELKLLSRDLLISVTNFFRDREMFRLLEAQVAPELLRENTADTPLCIWVPGCATGEEAYSISMLFHEQIAATQKTCPLQIFATDIDESALAFARRGVYTASELAEVGSERVGRFFARLDDHTYQVKNQVRDSVLFASQDILRDAPFSKLDLISCRNLLIYLEPEMQQKVVLLLHFALREDGFLVLGPSETVGREIDLFEPVSKKWRIYRRRGGDAAESRRRRMEAMSMNEELQSANEELETSKEELQSLNEELNSVNSQLQGKLEKLESTNNDLANLLSSADIATLFLGADYRIKRLSAAATRLLKLIPGDVGRPIGDIVARFSDPDLHGDVDAVIGELTAREKEVRSEDGRWYLRRITPYRTFDNRIEGVVVAFTEVTQLKDLEAELRRLAGALEERVAKRTAQLAAEVHDRENADASLLAERNFVSEVLSTMPALVMVTDRDGLVVRFNRACEQASARSFEQVQGKSVFDLLPHPEDAENVRRTFAELAAGGGPSRTQNTWQRPDGTRRLIAWWNNVLRDGAGRVEYIIRTGIDITEQHRAEDEARQRLAELTHMHRVHTAGELATALAHELNQPLAAIAGYSDACLNKLRAGDASSDVLARNLEQISTQAQRAGKVIRELRSFLAKAELQKAPTDANALARQAFGLLAADARARNVRLESDLADSLPKVMVAALSIEHVLVNLMSNGIEAVRAGGAGKGTVAIRTRAENGSIRITVTDTGRGIAPDVAERIFEPFYTTKQDGLGMGLGICRSIVESHGGRIWAEAGPRGVIHLTLPVSS